MVKVVTVHFECEADKCKRKPTPSKPGIGGNDFPISGYHGTITSASPERDKRERWFACSKAHIRTAMANALNRLEGNQS